MNHSNLVANKLHSAGFRTRIIVSNAVEVSLTSRKVNLVEVETATEQLFDGIQFDFSPSRNGIIVTW